MHALGSSHRIILLSVKWSIFFFLKSLQRVPRMHSIPKAMEMLSDVSWTTSLGFLMITKLKRHFYDPSSLYIKPSASVLCHYPSLYKLDMISSLSKRMEQTPRLAATIPVKLVVTIRVLLSCVIRDSARSLVVLRFTWWRQRMARRHQNGMTQAGVPEMEQNRLYIS